MLCSDLYLSLQRTGIVYVKTDFFVHGQFTWRGKVHAPNLSREVVIVGHSDYGVTDAIVARYPDVPHWFVINNFCVTAQNVTTLPLGITNNTDESTQHRVYENMEVMAQIVAEPIGKQANLAYLNITTGTYPLEREEVVQRFASQPWVTMEEPDPSELGRARFLRQIRRHSFCFCPRGNGLDTHRLWETLYMAAYPIVRYHTAYAHMSDLPILFVDNWADVTEELLRAKAECFATMEWNYPKLYFPYWESVILKRAAQCTLERLPQARTCEDPPEPCDNPCPHPE